MHFEPWLDDAFKLCLVNRRILANNHRRPLHRSHIGTECTFKAGSENGHLVTYSVTLFVKVEMVVPTDDGYAHGEQDSHDNSGPRILTQYATQSQSPS